jgi:hypothetical protein
MAREFAVRVARLPKLQARGLMMWWFHFRHDAKRVGIVIIEAPIVVCAPDRPSRRVREMLSNSLLHP